MIIALIIMFGPPIFLAFLGQEKYKKNEKKSAMISFVLAAIYLLIGLGFCGGMVW